MVSPREFLLPGSMGLIVLGGMRSLAGGVNKRA